MTRPPLAGLTAYAPAPYASWVSLWDLDNCLADDKWRTPLIDWHLDGNERYNRYDAQMHKDGPAHTAEWRIITQMSRPVFITGRRERWRSVTREWIIRHLPMLRHGRLEWQTDPRILMRPDDDDSKPVDVKRSLLHRLHEYGATFDSVIAAFDDVPAIVDMYLDHNIPATVLQVHDPKLAYKPEDL